MPLSRVHTSAKAADVTKLTSTLIIKQMQNNTSSHAEYDVAPLP